MRIGIGILLAVLVAATALRQSMLIARLGFDGENSPTESDSLFALRRVCTRGTLYLDYNQAPHVITAYMPLFYWSAGLIAKHATDWLGMVIMARCSVYIYWLGIGVLIFSIARQANCSWSASLAAALLWGANPLGHEWANSFRADADALFFSLAAIWAYRRGRRWVNTAASIGLLVVAFLYKQTAVAPVVVIVMEEILRRNFRGAAVIAGVWSAAAMAIILIGQVVTNGRFLPNVLVSAEHAALWSWAWTLLEVALALGVVTFSGAVLACVATGRQPDANLLKRYFVVSLALALPRTRIFGAWTNHYLEPFAAACVLTALLVQDLATRDTRGLVRWVRGGWLATSLGILIGSLAVDAGQVFQSRPEAHDAQLDQFVARVGAFGDPLLSEDGYLMVRSGRTPYLMDPNYFRHLQSIGKFDDTELVDKIRRGEFPGIITRFPIDVPPRPGRTFPRRWLDPMRVRYQLEGIYPVAERGVTFYLYCPGPAR